MTHAHGLYRDTRASPSAEAEPHGGPARTLLGQQRSPLHRSGFTCSCPEFSPPYFLSPSPLSEDTAELLGSPGGACYLTRGRSLTTRRRPKRYRPERRALPSPWGTGLQSAALPGQDGGRSARARLPAGGRGFDHSGRRPRKTTVRPPPQPPRPPTTGNHFPKWVSDSYGADADGLWERWSKCQRPEISAQQRL